MSHFHHPEDNSNDPTRQINVEKRRGIILLFDIFATFPSRRTGKYFFNREQERGAIQFCGRELALTG